MHLAESSGSTRLGSQNLPGVPHTTSPLPCTTQEGRCLLVLLKILQPTTHLSRCFNRCFVSIDINTHLPKLQHYIPKRKRQLPIVVFSQALNHDVFQKYIFWFCSENSPQTTNQERTENYPCLNFQSNIITIWSHRQKHWFYSLILTHLALRI